MLHNKKGTHWISHRDIITKLLQSIRATLFMQFRRRTRLWRNRARLSRWLQDPRYLSCILLCRLLSGLIWCLWRCWWCCFFLLVCFWLRVEGADLEFGLVLFEDAFVVIFPEFCWEESEADVEKSLAAICGRVGIRDALYIRFEASLPATRVKTG